jgi:hypothetical protein
VVNYLEALTSLSEKTYPVIHWIGVLLIIRTVLNLATKRITPVLGTELHALADLLAGKELNDTH